MMQWTSLQALLATFRGSHTDMRFCCAGVAHTVFLEMKNRKVYTSSQIHIYPSSEARQDVRGISVNWCCAECVVHFSQRSSHFIL